MERKYFEHGKDEVATLLQFNGMVLDELCRSLPHTIRELKPMARHFNRLIKIGYEKIIEEGHTGWREWRRYANMTAAAVYHEGVCDLVRMSIKEIAEKGKPLVVDGEKSLDAMAKVTMDMFENHVGLPDATLQIARMIQDVDTMVKGLVKQGIMTKEQAKKVGFGVILTDDLKEMMGEETKDEGDEPIIIH